MLETIESAVPISAAARLLLGALEERFARRTEYFRLQSIAMLSWLLSFVIEQTHPGTLGFHLPTPIFISLAFACLCGFIASFRVYKRSKVFYAKAKEKAQLYTSLFCPHCGTENKLDASYCRACGQDLGAVAKALRGHRSRRSRLDNDLASTERAFSRWSSGRLIAMTTVVFVAMIAVTVEALGHRNYTLALSSLLFYLPLWLTYFHLLVARRREGALRNPGKAKENATRILKWLSANQESFEKQGVSEALLTGAIDGPLRVEQTKAALDLLENREIVVRLTSSSFDIDGQPCDPNVILFAGGGANPGYFADKQEAERVLVKPGRAWPQAKATVALPPSDQAGSLSTQPMHILEDPSVKTTAPLPNRTANSNDPRPR